MLRRTSAGWGLNENMNSKELAELGTALEKAAQIVDEYRYECERTRMKFAEATDETSERIYWRADGASDALEIVA